MQIFAPWTVHAEPNPADAILSGFRIRDARGTVVAEIFNRPYPVVVDRAHADLLAAAPAMRDAIAAALPWIERTGIADDEPAEWAGLVAALALAGGDTVAGTAAPDYAAILRDIAGQMTVEAVLRIIGGPDWRAIAASLLPYAESRAEDMLENCDDACQGDEPSSRDLADKAVMAVDAAKAALAGDTVAAMSAPQDDADAMRLALESAEHWLAEEAASPNKTEPVEILRVIRAALGKG